MALSIGIRNSISLLSAIQATRLLTITLVGLSPTEHTSFSWSRFRTAGFPQSGWKAGLSDGALPVVRERCRDVRFASAFRAPRCLYRYAPVLNPGTRCAGAPPCEQRICSTPGVLVPVRVIVSRSISTYSTPSAPLAGTARLRRRAAYTRCPRCAPNFQDA